MADARLRELPKSKRVPLVPSRFRTTAATARRLNLPARLEAYSQGKSIRAVPGFSRNGRLTNRRSSGFFFFPPPPKPGSF